MCVCVCVRVRVGARVHVCVRAGIRHSPEEGVGPWEGH